jgi:hypothetical protein
MSLRDAFVNVAQSAATAAANRAVSSVVQGVAAGLKGNNPQNDTAPLDRSVAATDLILSFPNDVSIDPMQGHYIMFGIRSQTPGQLSPNLTGSRDGTLNASIKGLMKQAGIDANRVEQIGRNLIENFSKDTFINSNQIMRNSIKNQKNNKSLVLKRMPYSNLIQTIALYMPPQVTVQYAAKYADTEIGVGAEAGSKLLTDLYDGRLTFATATDTLGDAAVQIGKQTGIKLLDTVAPGAKALVALERGKIITPRIELMFEGIGRRSFEFTFIMIPKSASEAQLIRQIVNAFKENMIPDVATEEFGGSANVREVNIPNVFDIKYMYRGQENQHLNKISTSFLTNMNVQYGGDRYTAFEPDATGSPPPQRTTLTLTFQEIDLVYRDKVKEGF